MVMLRFGRDKFANLKAGTAQCLSKLRLDTRGVTAIEFALVAPVFLYMSFMSIETAVYYFKINRLQSVVQDTHRFIQTGGLQAANNEEQAFKDFVCNNAEPFLDCEEIDYDVVRFSNLADVAQPAAQFNANGNATNFSYNMSGSGAIVRTRMSLPHRFITPWVQNAFTPDGEAAVIYEYTVGRLEPIITAHYENDDPGTPIVTPPVTTPVTPPEPEPVVHTFSGCTPDGSGGWIYVDNNNDGMLDSVDKYADYFMQYRVSRDRYTLDRLNDYAIYYNNLACTLNTNSLDASWELRGYTEPAVYEG